MKLMRRIVLVLGMLLLLVIAGALFYVHEFDFSESEERIEARFRDAPFPLRRGSLVMDGRTVSFSDIGNPLKPMVMLVHGSPGMWDNFMDLMANETLLEQVRLVAINRFGYGPSAEGGYEPSLEMQAASVLKVIDYLSPDEPATLLGFSYGGPVVARAAMDAPSRVAALIFLGASIDPSLEETKWYQYPAAVPPISWLIPSDLLVCNLEIMALKDELEAMMPGWKRITQPVIVIQGGQDNLVPSANADFAERVLVNAPVTMKRYPDLNHFIHWTHPNIVIDSILELVESHPSRYLQRDSPLTD